MIKRLLLFSFLLTSLLKAEPLMVIVLMVKNEETVINATLEPFLRAVPELTRNDDLGFFIFDTGSTDKTVETVEAYFKENSIKNYTIMQEPFVDFATSRNRSIVLAKEKFSKSNFLLLIDAEWYGQNIATLIQFCKNNINNPCPSYLFRVLSGNTDFCANRLMRTDANCFFKGVVHEVLMSDANQKLPYEICFEYKPRDRGIAKSAQRWLRDRDLLLKHHNENPNDSRTTFYLAQTYECLNDPYNAYKYYDIRSKQNGWDEENFETFYRLGRVSDLLSKIDNKFTWHMAFDYYMKAHQLRPHRAEPLIKISEHYWPDTPNKEGSNIPASYLFARRTLDLEYPKNDTLFIDKDIYDFGRYEAVSKAAWHVGEYEMGQQATLNAIKAKIPYLYNNLMCYTQAMKNHVKA